MIRDVKDIAGNTVAAFSAGECGLLAPWLASTGWTANQWSTVLDLSATSDSIDLTLLAQAACLGEYAAVEMLAKHCDLNAKTALSGATPLMLAARSNCLRSCQALLDAGADPKAIDHSGRDALRHAADAGSLKSLMFLSHVCDPKSTNNAGRSAIFYAIESRSPEAADCVELLMRVSDLSAINEAGYSPLDLAKITGKTQIAGILGDYMRSLSERSELSKTIPGSNQPKNRPRRLTL